jgi:hypothetical protein
MITKALEFLKANFKDPTISEINGRQFAIDNWHLIPKTFDEPTPNILTVNTLTGLVDYIKSRMDITPGAVIHIESPGLVRLISPLFGDNLQRKQWIQATTEKTLSNGFRFGGFMPIPDFIIQIQAYFSETEDVKKLLALVSNIKAEQGQEYTDNGVSQSVVAKRSTGSSMVATVQVPNPVSLRPYRTFLEVEQPESSFVFRLTSGGEGNPPQCGLWEASGGAWKLNAIQRIKLWLEDQATGCKIIA